MRLFDAHNHLQDERFDGRREVLLAEAASAGVTRMVVNGSSEEDWTLVAELARADARIVPSFGYHPWYVAERSPDWKANLTRCLAAAPAGVGEIGLDRWKPGLDYADQEEVFLTQLEIAALNNVPATIHCLRCWGRLDELLRSRRLPECGVLLHSYGGPREMVRGFAKLGAYFSFPGYFAHERKTRQRSAFLAVPPDRLLLETDAPDQTLPLEMDRYALTDPETGKRLNHPANLAATHAWVAKWLGEPEASLAQRLEENFRRLFGGVMARGGE